MKGVNSTVDAAPSAPADSTAETRRGLWPAIVDFLASPEGAAWTLWKRDAWSHGLTVLRRVSTLHHGAGASKVQAHSSV